MISCFSFHRRTLLAGHHRLSLCGLILLASAGGLRADSDLWTGAALGSPTWSNTLNWLPHLPNGGDDLLFGTSGQMNTQVDTSFSVGSITFAPGAPAYTINVNLGVNVLISGVGVVNNSASTQTFTTIGSDGGTASSSVVFAGTSTASNAAFVLGPSSSPGLDGGYLQFTDSATAANATITTSGPTVQTARGGAVFFAGNSKAGNATFNNLGAQAGQTKGGNLTLDSNTTAGNAVIVNQGAIADTGLGGFVHFGGNGTAANATITCNGTAAYKGDGGQTYFLQTSTAGNATLISNGALASGGDGGYFYFGEGSSAGTATIIANGSGIAGADGGYTYFFDYSEASKAHVTTNAGAFLDISGMTGRGVNIGTVEGAGTVLLGAKTLNTGMSNLSTTLSGPLKNDGYIHGYFGSINKLGTGTLTLTGASTYTGGTLVTAGTLVVSGSSTGTSSVSVSPGATLSLGGTGILGQAATVVTISAGGTLTGGGTLNGAVTNSGTVVVDGSGQSLTLTGDVVNNGTIRLTGGAQLVAVGASSFVNNGIVDILGGTASLPPNFSNGAGGIVVDMSSTRVGSVSRAGGGLMLTVNSYTGHAYQLQRADAVGGPYVNVEAAQSGSTGAALTFTHQESAASKQGFYRVQVDQSTRFGTNGQDKVGGAKANPVYPGKVRREPAP